MSGSQQQPVARPSENEIPDWKLQLAERLDAYRAKHPEAISPQSSTSNTLADSRASRIARSVASRYAAAPTYKELLLAAAQAEQAAAEAQAALAERVALDARVAREKITQDQTAQDQTIQDQNEAVSSADREQTLAESDDASIRTQPATPVMPRFAARTQEMHLHQSAPEPEPSLEDLWASALVEPREMLPSKLIEFPRELVSSRRARPRLPENPASGLDPAAQEAEPAQLRIFEVHPEVEPGDLLRVNAQADAPILESNSPSSEIAARSISKDTPKNLSPDAAQNPLLPDSSPAASASAQHAATNRAGIDRSEPPVLGSSQRAAFTATRSNTPAANVPNSSATRTFKNLEWAAISLDKGAVVSSRQIESSVADYIPFLVDPASIDRRMMAFAVDFSAVTAGFLAFLMVFAASTPHLPGGLTAVVLAGAVYVALWVLYQMLFFSLSGATAGMLYARIALCTFDDRNPTRRALRRRLAAWWLSCLPLGMGFLWCFVDEDNLSWHDRITRMYQREY